MSPKSPETLTDAHGQSGNFPLPKGHDAPRLATPSFDGPGVGQELVDLANDLGMPLLPWQTRIVEDAHRGAPGEWKHRVVGVTVARQNGKSALLQLRIAAGLLLWNEKLIVATAQSREVALETFRGVVTLIEQSPKYVAQIKSVTRSYGREELTLRNGCRYRLVAPTAGGARGFTAHLAVVDELREHHSYDAYAAISYTTTVPKGQLWFASNAGDSSSIVLNDMRRQALAQSEPGDIYYAEWSADPKLDVDDPEAWAQANPSMGHLVDASVIESRLRTDPRPIFETEALCRWVDVLDSPWPPNAWADCADPDLELEKGVPTFLAVDVSIDRRHAALVAVQVLADDKIGAHLLDTWTADGAIDELGIAAAIAPIARSTNARSVAFDRYTAAGIASRLASVGIPVGDCSGAQFAQACDELLSSMVHGRLVHGAQTALTEHVLACVKKPVSDGGWRIVRRQSSGPIAGAVALAMATHYALQPIPRAEVIFA
jgi:phage terminase large subunit-like protein